MDEFFRIAHLPPYPLGEIAQAVRDARVAGQDIIDLSQVNPNLGPPGIAVDKLVQSCLQIHNHRYSSSQGITALRQAIAGWYDKRFGVEVSADSEVVVTMGTKEGLSHLLLSMASPGDTVIVPTPSYPIHTSAVFISGAGFVGLPLFSSYSSAEEEGYLLSEKSDDFFERLRVLYNHTWPRPKAMVLSFPHNPTATVVTKGFFERLVEFALGHGLYLVHDFAYADICFDGYQAPSILEIDAAREIAVEFYSLSKGFGMAGWRIGFCVGNEKLVGALKKIKSYLDFGVFQPLQIAARAALLHASEHGAEWLAEAVSVYQTRRDVLVDGLRDLGWTLHTPKGTVFVWARIPDYAVGEGSLSFGHRLLAEAKVAVCPGIGFDVQADHYMRFALVENERCLRAATQRMQLLSVH